MNEVLKKSHDDEKNVKNDKINNDIDIDLNDLLNLSNIDNLINELFITSFAFELKHEILSDDDNLLNVNEFNKVKAKDRPRSSQEKKLPMSRTAKKHVRSSKKDPSDFEYVETAETAKTTQTTKLQISRDDKKDDKSATSTFTYIRPQRASKKKSTTTEMLAEMKAEIIVMKAEQMK
ncbi:MAG: hypothetical protein Q9201_004152 [Fulgogasparrea decipioides]